MSTLTRRMAALAAVSLIFLAGSAGAIAAEIAGTWKGTVRQEGFGSYAVEMRIDDRGGQIEYPRFRCGGALVPLGSADGGMKFREDLHYGVGDATRRGCATGGIVQVSVQDPNTIKWEWFDPDRSRGIYVTGTLFRAAQ